MSRVEAAPEVDRATLAPWLAGRTFDEWRADFDRAGYVVFPRVMTPDEVERIRAALEPHLARDIPGRNDFEGRRSNRVYALLAKSPVFAEMAAHPLPLAFAEADLGRSCLLSAMLAINLHPGETAQPWHWDDGHLSIPLPHPSYGVSAFWTIDDTTAENGATEVIPGSHRWGMEPRMSEPGDFTDRITGDAADPSTHPDAVAVELPAGSLMIAKGTLRHRGGANRSDRDRLIVTPQYCPGWARQLENMIAVVPRRVAAGYPKRVRELIGYSIHPPFMGYVDGVHPEKLLPADVLDGHRPSA